MPRPISKFALTVPRFNSKDVLYTIFTYEFRTKVFAISKELHSTSSVAGQEEEHLHAFFELDPDSEDTAIDSVRQRLHSLIQAITNQDIGFDIQSAKRPDKWLKYITKVSTNINVISGMVPALRALTSACGGP